MTDVIEANSNPALFPLDASQVQALLKGESVQVVTRPNDQQLEQKVSLDAKAGKIWATEYPEEGSWDLPCTQGAVYAVGEELEIPGLVEFGAVAFDEEGKGHRDLYVRCVSVEVSDPPSPDGRVFSTFEMAETP